MSYRLKWVRPGTVTWEEGWTRTHGRTRSETPDLAQHVSFANFDLRDHGHNPISAEDGTLSVEVEVDRLRDLLEIVRRHGFELDESTGADIRPSIDAGPVAWRPSAATLVDVIENFYDQSIPSVVSRAESLRRDDGKLASFLRADEFLELHRTTWCDAAPVPPPLESGELRPFFARARPDLFAADGSYARGYSPDVDADLLTPSIPDADSKEIKALLLYAHSAVISDPFVPRDAESIWAKRFSDPVGWSPQSASGGYYQWVRANSGLGERPYDFLNALELVAALADLVRDGIVFICPPAAHDAIYFGDQDIAAQAAVSALDDAGFIHEAVRHPIRRIGLGTGQADRHARLVASVVLQRAMDQLRALLTFGSSGTVLVAGDYDEIGLDVLVTEMIRSGAIEKLAVDRNPEDIRLTLLSQLTLPGVDGLRAKDIAAVRDHDLFGTFRNDVKRSLAELDHEGLGASAEFRESMQVAARRLGLQTRRSAAMDEFRKNAVAWGIGALLGWSIGDWRASLLGPAIGASGYVAARVGSGGKNALLNHYVAVS